MSIPNIVSSAACNRRTPRNDPAAALGSDEVLICNASATATRPLVCAECGITSPPGAAGWRSYLTDDGEAVVFCPECAEREFGDKG